MKVYFVRHGETVDNVAGLYAGVRDSALTNHGVEQARRLGDFFAKNGVRVTHLFASPLTRARKTAEAVLLAQRELSGKEESLDIVQVPDLIEQDFGFYEGKPFSARSDPKKTGRETQYASHMNESAFQDVESKESLAKRADGFLDEHLIPLLNQESADDTLIAVVVSHGILLAHLWRRLLLRLPKKSLTIAPEVTTSRGVVVLEHLGSWSNTGYLELVLSKVARKSLSNGSAEAGEAVEAPTLPTPVPLTVEVPAEPVSPRVRNANGVSEDRTLWGWSTVILAVDSKQHLTGLKRQRGGIGRLAHDEGQKKLDSFFKRQKTS